MKKLELMGIKLNFKGELKSISLLDRENNVRYYYNGDWEITKRLDINTNKERKYNNMLKIVKNYIDTLNLQVIRDNMVQELKAKYLTLKLHSSKGNMTFYSSIAGGRLTISNFNTIKEVEFSFYDNYNNVLIMTFDDFNSLEGEFLAMVEDVEDDFVKLINKSIVNNTLTYFLLINNALCKICVDTDTNKPVYTYFSNKIEKYNQSCVIDLLIELLEIGDTNMPRAYFHTMIYNVCKLEIA